MVKINQPVVVVVVNVVIDPVFNSASIDTGRILG
jgi:hypothetical protein